MSANSDKATRRPCALRNCSEPTDAGSRRSCSSSRTATPATSLPRCVSATTTPWNATWIRSSTSMGRKPHALSLSGSKFTANRGAPGGDLTWISAAPGMPFNTAATSAALPSRTSRSSPKTLTTTGAVSPATVSPIRSPRKVSNSVSIPGMLFRIPRISASATASSRPDIGLRSMWNSLRWGPHGSSPNSARPTCCSTVAICGLPSRAREIWPPMRSISGSEVPGAAEACSTK